MRIPRIYTAAHLEVGSELELDARASRHLLQVLRMRPGDTLLLFNGDGAEYEARLVAAERRVARARCEGYCTVTRESPLQVTLVQGVARGDRMDLSLQKAVELGAAALQPVFTERSVPRPDGQRLDRRMGHWQGVIVSAAEQSGRTRLPSLGPPLSLGDWLAEDPPTEPAVTLDPTATTPLAGLAAPQGRITLLVGPEGGLSDAELARAEAAGLQRVHLGPRTLRTETAGMATLAIIQGLWGDLGRGEDGARPGTRGQR